MIRQSGPLLTGLLAALLLWAPLPFGSVTPWAAATLQVLSFAALAVAAGKIGGLARPLDLRIFPAAAFAAASFAAVAGLALLQSLAWPEALVAWISPAHAAVWRQAAALPGVEAPGAPALSLDPGASRAAAWSWAAAAACLLAGAAAGRRRSRRRWLAGAVLAAALFQVFFGAQQWFARSPTLWGVEIPRSPRLHGTFVNPNHLALYLEMALAVAFAALWWGARRARWESQVERRVILLAIPGLLWLTLFTGLAFTGSRAGLLAAVAGVSAQGVLIAASRRRWRSAALGLGAAVAGIAVVAAVGLREGLGRILTTAATDVSLGARRREYAALADLWQRFPATGSGLGTLQDAFPAVQPPDLQGTWWHAHSDLLELLATAGLLGLLLVAAGLVPLVRRLLAVLAGQGRTEDRAAALAALGALVAVGVHEALDFGMTMPANALTLAVLAGAASAVEAVRVSSTQADAARHDPAPVHGVDLQEVQPGPQGDVQRKTPRRKHRKRS